jgi:hypothetical protein
VGVADHQPHPRQAALLAGSDERCPEGLARAIAHLDAEQFGPAVGVDAHGHHHGSGADLQSRAQPCLEVGGIEVNVGIARLLQWPAQEGLHLLSMSWQMRGPQRFPGISGVPLRLACDLEMPLCDPRAPTRVVRVRGR